MHRWKVRLEVGNYCNLRCPLCVRESINKNILNKIHLTVDDVKKFLPRIFLHHHVSEVYLSGAVAEPTLNPDFIEIVKHLMKYTKVYIDSNGSTRSVDWWKELGQTGVHCTFAPDSIKPKNNKYRINSNTEKVIRNIKAFTNAGGNSFWKYIPYSHNDDELEEQRAISDSIGSNFIFAQPRIIPKDVQEFLDITSSSIIRDDKPEISYLDKGTPEYYCKLFGDIEDYLIEISPEGIVYPCCMMPRDFYYTYENYFINGDPNPNLNTGNDPKRVSFRKTILPLIEENGGIESLSLHKNSIQKILKSPFYSILLKKSWKDKNSFCNNFCSSSKYILN